MCVGRGEGYIYIYTWEHCRKILFAYKKSETRMFEVSFNKGDYPGNSHVVFRLNKIIAVLLNLLCVWILFAYAKAHQNSANRIVQASYRL